MWKCPPCGPFILLSPCCRLLSCDQAVVHPGSATSEEPAYLFYLFIFFPPGAPVHSVIQHHVVPGLVSACTRRGQGKDWICQSASTLGAAAAHADAVAWPLPTPTHPTPPPGTHTPRAHTAHTHSLMELALTTDPNCLWTGSSCIIGAWPPRFMSINHSRQGKSVAAAAAFFCAEIQGSKNTSGWMYTKEVCIMPPSLQLH